MVRMIATGPEVVPGQGLAQVRPEQGPVQALPERVPALARVLLARERVPALVPPGQGPVQAARR